LFIIPLSPTSPPEDVDEKKNYFNKLVSTPLYYTSIMQ